MTKTLYLMRHGQTRLNVEGRVQGAYDSPLTDLGIAQAGMAKDYFETNGIRFDQVYSSTQERASDTAEIVSGQVPTRLKAIKEMDFGTFEAKEERLLPVHRPGTKSFEDQLVPYGGEDIRLVGKRVYEGLLAVLDQASDGDTLLAVSHGAAMWGFILHIDAVLPEGARFGNCAICRLTYAEGELTLEAVIDPTAQ
ncbi:histidine phosphatase family protein [Streptococcus moroccensis]|uniref:Phosphoglycerate mutase n=1 Tax=Streptococcus moroccensis TaxID=1451356 RepID=A0ABT9YRW8_9STRE|nr:histidine phosphatase family protein [Streptococcus moroccensis]MDQ0222744.1 putative phosphoglycerate mutase [Streptococcus moroccensis]